MKAPRLVTIVLNTNRRHDTLECLGSLAAQTAAAENHVIVLDNRSTDGSADAIRAQFPGVELISLEGDRGYAGNNNVGIRAALTRQAEWILVLNEDTVLDRLCLEQLLAAGEADPTIGMLGPLVFHHDEPTVIQSAGGRMTRTWEAFHIGANEDDRGQFSDHARAVDWISGCALMVRRRVVEQVGMLDERFYYYWEETEWCVRTARAGWQLINVPTARLWHKGVRRDYRPSPNVTYYNTRNRLLLLSKHRAPILAWMLAAAQTIRTLLSFSLRPKWRPLHAHRDAMWQGVTDFVNGRLGIRHT